MAPQHTAKNLNRSRVRLAAAALSDVFFATGSVSLIYVVTDASPLKVATGSLIVWVIAKTILGLVRLTDSSQVES